MGDATSCGQFKNCVDGRGFIFDCPEGLAFNGDTYRCDWPDQVTTCDAEGKENLVPLLILKNKFFYSFSGIYMSRC